MATTRAEYFFDRLPRMPLWTPESAETIAKTLTELRERLGRDMTKADVLEAARPKESALHPFFTWDDTKAAELHRLDEARYLLRHLKVKYIDVGPEHEEVTIRAFYAKPLDDDLSAPHEFIPTTPGDAASHSKLVRQALGELEDWSERYGHFSEFAGVVAAIDQVIERMVNT